MLTALEPTRSLGPRHSIDAAFHAYHTRSPRAKHKQNISMQRLIHRHSRLCAPARPARSPNMPRPSARIATMPLQRRPTAPLECLQTAQQAALKQRSSENLGWSGGLGGYVKAVAVRTGQDWPAREERGCDQVCGLARYLQARTETCARLSAPAPRSLSTSTLSLSLWRKPR